MAILLQKYEDLRKDSEDLFEIQSQQSFEGFIQRVVVFLLTSKNWCSKASRRGNIGNSHNSLMA
jgi:hypothetical protein